MFSTSPTLAMSVPLTSIRETLERHLSLTQGYLPSSIPSGTPLFDANLPPSASNSVEDHASRILSLGLPAPLASDVARVISQESDRYRAFVEEVCRRQLHELSTTSVSSDHSSIPALVEAACTTFHALLIKSGVDEVQQLSMAYHDGGLDGDPEEQSSSEYDDDTSSDFEQQSEPDEVAFNEGEEDDNSPIKPDEDIPPLETKYLPIFEALHERGKVLTKPEKTYLVNMTGMTYRQITIWFQNRRRGELKESSNIHTKAPSTFSDGSSEFSESELEKSLGAARASTAFDIRLWRMTSAFPSKDGIRNSSTPSSPVKRDFGVPVTAINLDSDTDLTDLSDSDDEMAVPPGLLGPLLSTPTVTTTATTISTRNNSRISPHVIGSAIAFSSEHPISARPTRPLPSNRTKSPTSSSQLLEAQAANILNQHDSVPDFTATSRAINSLDYSVTSNDRGLTIQMDVSLDGSIMVLPSPSTLRSSTTSVSSPNLVASPSRNISPTPSTHCGLSPRLAVKPLPRRTGCAPRPRPPPRSAAPSSTTIPLITPSSSRASVVLPPSSNPSLGSTTLGSLLRPNQPAPRISPEIEERLVGMAERMGVGRGDNLNLAQPISERTTGTAPSAARSGFQLSSFEPKLLPNLGTSLGSASSHTPNRSSDILTGLSHS